MQAKLLTINEIINRKDRFLLKPYKSGIFLFGEFRILDSEGRNIIGQFTPKMQEILAYLIIRTRPNGAGVSAEKLSELFWEGFDKKEAKNNRGAILSKLRKAMENLEGADIITDGQGWKIEYDDRFYCDYFELLELSALYFNASSFEEKRLLSLNILDVLRAGIILKDFTREWVDEKKAEITDYIIRSATGYFEKHILEEDLYYSLLISETVLVWEPLNEVFFRIKMQILNKLGRFGEVKEAYDFYAAEYHKTFGNPLSVPLSAMLQK
jgi:two-component SAPR family response regulator